MRSARSVHPTRRTAGRPAGAALAVVVALAAKLAAAQPEPTIPRPLGYVSDYAGRLRVETVRELDGLIRELRERTGAEIAVVVVDSTAPLSAFDYAMRVAEVWKPGAVEKDNGVVFLVAAKDRELFILTGYGVEGVLPDGRVGEIRDRIVLPAFRRGDMDAGIREATRTMAAIIAAQYGVTLSAAPPPAAPGEPLGPLFTLFALGVLVLALYTMAKNPHLAAAVGGRGRRGRDRNWGGGFGGGGFGGGGGGFGGFGGGGFGGGGAGGRW